MKLKQTLGPLLMAAIVTTFISTTVSATQAPKLVDYQGFLVKANGTPMDTTLDMVFKIYTASTSGTQKWTETQTSVVITAGIFNVTLGSVTAMDDAVFNADTRWLETKVGTTTFDRVRIVSSAYSLRVQTVDGATGGTVTSALTVSGDITGTKGIFSGDVSGVKGTFTGDVAGVKGTFTGDVSGAKGNFGASNTNAGTNAFVAGNSNTASGPYSTVSGGKDNIANGLHGTVAGGLSDTASGDYSTVSGGHNNATGGSLATIGGGTGNVALGNASTIGGGSNDTVYAFSEEATIGGGAGNAITGNYTTIAGGHLNNVTGNWGAIGGGAMNVASSRNSVVSGGGSWPNGGNTASADWSSIGGGDFNTASHRFSRVSGGENNLAAGQWSVVGGGQIDTITDSGFNAVIAGGHLNKISANHGVIGGGHNNEVSARHGVIPGGRDCVVSGVFGFAAGRRAKATAGGAFAWSDTTDVDFTNSTANSFQIRARGGVIFYTDSALTNGVTLAAGGGSWSSISDSTKKQNIREVDYSQVLEQLEALPIKQWSYKTQSPDIEHIGPMAQDFYAIYGLGDDNVTINTIDPSGIALAAIKALYQTQKELQASMDDLQMVRAEVAQLREMMEIVLASSKSKVANSTLASSNASQ